MRNRVADLFVGFDKAMDSLLDGTSSNFNVSAFPPFNLVRSDTGYELELAVAGFSREEITVTTQEGSLWVSGRKDTKRPLGDYIHKAISERAFKRFFPLAPSVTPGEVTLVNGILTIELLSRENESVKKLEIIEE